MYVFELKKFGTVGHVYVPEVQRGQWDDKSKEMIFVGFEGLSDNYCLYNPEKRTVEVHRNVVFDKNLRTRTASSNWN